jgi:hypothetical protein
MHPSKQSAIEALKQLLALSGGPRREGWAQLPRSMVDKAPANEPIYFPLFRNLQKTGHLSAKKNANLPGIGALCVNKCQKLVGSVPKTKCLFSWGYLGSPA